MTGPEQDTDVQDSSPNADGHGGHGGHGGDGGPDGRAGDMGVSSERVGPSGAGEVGTDGVRDTSKLPDVEDAPPEQSEGGLEVNPDDPTPSQAGYPQRNPRSAERAYEPPR